MIICANPSTAAAPPMSFFISAIEAPGFCQPSIVVDSCTLCRRRLNWVYILLDTMFKQTLLPDLPVDCEGACVVEAQLS